MMHELANAAVVEKSITVQAAITEAYDKMLSLGASEGHPVMGFLADWIDELSNKPGVQSLDFWNEIVNLYKMR